MGVNKRGSINIFVLTMIFVLLGGISILLYQYGRLQQGNHMFYQKNQAMHIAFALEEKFMDQYTSLGIGHHHGFMDEGEYCVIISQKSVGHRIFIVVEFENIPYTVDINLDGDGNIENRFDNVPKGESSCW